jgi:glycosyltransferase involved in cell wall biosynthesis
MWLYGVEPQMAKLDDRITYYKKPSDSEVNKLFNQSTLFVQTSRHEGFGLPMLEAMAAGCPLICTDAHGNRDFCKDGYNCLIVNHDDVKGLSRAIIKLLKDKNLQKKLSQAGLKTAKKYRWDVIMDQVERFYKEVAKQ